MLGASGTGGGEGNEGSKVVSRTAGEMRRRQVGLGVDGRTEGGNAGEMRSRHREWDVDQVAKVAQDGGSADV